MNSHAGLSVAAFAALALSPDLDFFAEASGADGTALDHRVMTHSFAFAMVIGLALGFVFAPPRCRWLGSALCVAALGSHGLLDAMTANGPGPQLLWPFAGTAIQLAWHPIPGTQTYQEYFTATAIPVFGVEALMSLPFVAATVWILSRGGTPRTPPNE